MQPLSASLHLYVYAPLPHINTHTQAQRVRWISVTGIDSALMIDLAHRFHLHHLQVGVLFDNSLAGCVGSGCSGKGGEVWRGWGLGVAVLVDGWMAEGRMGHS
jgi:hypothetical protein